jgi:hypothetical protein
MNNLKNKLSDEIQNQPSCLDDVSGSVFDIKSEVIFNGITYNQHIGFDGLLFYCKQIKK